MISEVYDLILEEVDGNAVVLQAVDSHGSATRGLQGFPGDELQETHQGHSCLQLGVNVSQVHLLLHAQKNTGRNGTC